MYERSYGYRYAELGEHPSAAEIAKAMRRDIKQAQAEGLLPKRWAYSVRSDHGSMYQSVDLEVRDCPDAWQPCDGDCHDVWCAARNDPAYAHAAKPHEVLSEEASAAKVTLQRIHNAYNHDGSDIQTDYFDVRYYGHVTFETADGYAFRMKEKARLEARKSSREQGKVCGKARNYKRDGSSVTHLLVETDNGQVFACGAHLWSRSLIGRVDDDERLTCSRCAKREASYA